mmetsp:Transcript_93841/g.287120  ORF Transcript_93841/g.287120 Transcript_93841/m.287120 type:complete len:285 (-) Transcript_93841:679-1533(-)
MRPGLHVRDVFQRRGCGVPGARSVRHGRGRRPKVADRRPHLGRRVPADDGRVLRLLLAHALELGRRRRLDIRLGRVVDAEAAVEHPGLARGRDRAPHKLPRERGLRQHAEVADRCRDLEDDGVRLRVGARPGEDAGHAVAHGVPRHHEGPGLPADGERGARLLVRLQSRRGHRRPRRRARLHLRTLRGPAAVLRRAARGGAAERPIHAVQDGVQHGVAGPSRGLPWRAPVHAAAHRAVRERLRAGHRLLLRPLVHRPGRRGADAHARLGKIRLALPLEGAQLFR